MFIETKIKIRFTDDEMTTLQLMFNEWFVFMTKEHAKIFKSLFNSSSKNLKKEFVYTLNKLKDLSECLELYTSSHYNKETLVCEGISFGTASAHEIVRKLKKIVEIFEQKDNFDW